MTSSAIPCDREGAKPAESSSASEPSRKRASKAVENGALLPGILDPRDRGWRELAESHPDGTIFHSAAWAKVLIETYGHVPFYLRYSKGEETAALLPLMEVKSPFTGTRGVCLPFSDFCAPLIFDGGDPERMRETLFSLGRKRRWKSIEIRGRAPFVPESALPSAIHFAHTLDLRRHPDQLFAGFDSSVRRAIRKAKRQGVSARISRSRESMRSFYRLHEKTRRRHGLPPQPLSFFLNLHREIVEPGNGFVVLAEQSAQPVAGAVFLHSGRQAVFKFGASDKAFQADRGSNLMMWRGIEFLAESGAESLHFGRTSQSNEGLRRFKRGWGTQEERLPYYQCHPASEAWVPSRETLSGLHNHLFRRLPLALNRLAGSLLYPHLD